MILDGHYAVVFKPQSGMKVTSVAPTMTVMDAKNWEYLQDLAQAGHFIILEAWDIVHGKCVSN